MTRPSRSRADEIAAVLVEPVQSRNSELRPTAFVRELRQLTPQIIVGHRRVITNEHEVYVRAGIQFTTAELSHSQHTEEPVEALEVLHRRTAYDFDPEVVARLRAVLRRSGRLSA